MSASGQKAYGSTTTQSAPSIKPALPVLKGADTPLPEGFLVGSAEDTEAGTGCTAICCPEGAVAGVAVRGGAPATRETDLLSPENTVQAIHAVVLTGGSAFGLDAASGVMRWLEERSAGFAFAGRIVPIVCGASLFDLTVGDGSLRPDDAMGYAACDAAQQAAGTIVSCGNVGAGTGASVGKLLGAPFAMKAGLGAAGLAIDGLIVSALVALNALGSVHDRFTGRWLAGTRDPADPTRLLDPYEALSLTTSPQPAGSNTTIACVLTNAALEKSDLSRVASMAHDGFARAIEPIHTSADGDAIFALARGEQHVSADLVGCLAALAIEHAIHVATLSAKSAYGLSASCDLIYGGPERKDIRP